jgi:hypothetical protein
MNALRVRLTIIVLTQILTHINRRGRTVLFAIGIKKLIQPISKSPGY